MIIMLSQKKKIQISTNIFLYQQLLKVVAVKLQCDTDNKCFMDWLQPLKNHVPCYLNILAQGSKDTLDWFLAFLLNR